MQKDGTDFHKPLSTQGEIWFSVKWALQAAQNLKFEVAMPDVDEYRTVEELQSQRVSRISALRGLQSSRRDFTVGTLTVTIKAAKGLLAADRGGKSDPYAKLKLNDEVFVTETIKKTVNPVWNQARARPGRHPGVIQRVWSLSRSIASQDFVFKRDHLRDFCKRPLRLEVFDDDVLTFDDSLGVAKLMLQDVVEVPGFFGKGLKIKVALPVKGFVYLVVSISELEEPSLPYIGYMFVEPLAGPVVNPVMGLSNLPQQAQRLRKEHSEATFMVHVLGASSLKASDRGGTSDPYVKIHLGDERRRTTTIPRNLNPRWDEMFEFRGKLYELCASKLCFEVFDYDELSRDDCLGVADGGDALTIDKVTRGRMLPRGCIAPVHDSRMRDTWQVHDYWTRGGSDRTVEFTLPLQAPEGSKMRNIKGEIYVKVDPTCVPHPGF